MAYITVQDGESDVHSLPETLTIHEGKRKFAGLLGRGKVFRGGDPVPHSPTIDVEAEEIVLLWIEVFVNRTGRHQRDIVLR